MLALEGVDWALVVANSNFIIHPYDELNRALTWETLSVDRHAWAASFRPLL